MSIAPRTIESKAGDAPPRFADSWRERDLPGIPQRNASIRIGIDVGYRFVKSATVNIVGKKPTPVWVRGFERPRDRDLSQILGDELSLLTQKLAPKKVQVVLGLESEFANIRYVKFANVPSSGFARAAQIEASSHIFLAEEDLQVEVRPYREPDKASKVASHGVVCAIQASEVQRRLQAMQEAGARDGGIALTSVAVVHGCLHMGITSPDRVHAIIDIGARSGKIIIHRGHEIYLMRDFLTELHRREPEWKVDLCYLQAERATAGGEASPSMFSAALSVDSITNEILMSVSFFSRECGYNIDHATLIGGETELEGLFEALQKKINVPLVQMRKNPPSLVADKARRNDTFRRNLPLVFPALCLALVDPSTPDFGYVPLKKKLFADSRWRVLTWRKVAIFFVAIYAFLFVSSLGLRRSANLLQQSCATLVEKKSRLAELVSVWEFEVEKRTKKTRPQASRFEGAPSYRADLLTLVAGACPPDVWLARLSSRGVETQSNDTGKEQSNGSAYQEEIAVEGYAATPAAADRFADSFLQTRLFDKLTISHLSISLPDSLSQHVRFAVSLLGEKHAAVP